MVDIWETDSSGNYDVQHDDYSGPNCRGVLESDQDGVFWFKAIVPVSYPSKWFPSNFRVDNLRSSAAYLS